MPSQFLSLRRDKQGRIAERTLNLGGEAEIRRYAYDSAGRLARVADGSGGLLESYQYDHEGRRLADINPQRFRGERRYSSTWATGWGRPVPLNTATTRRASAT